MDLAKMMDEFKNYELDAGKIDTQKYYQSLMILKETLDLSTGARCRAADSALSNLLEIIGFKAGRAHYWERIFSERLKYSKLEAKHHLKALPENKGTTKEDLMELVEMDENVRKISEQVTNASASRFFWGAALDILHDIGKRIDSSSASIGVETKMRPQ